MAFPRITVTSETNLSIVRQIISMKLSQEPF